MNTRYSSTIRIVGERIDAAAVSHPAVRVTLPETGAGYTWRRMTLENPTGANSPQITEPYTLDAQLPCTGTASLHTLRGDNCSKDSFLPIDRELAVGETFTMKPTGGRSSNTTAFPYFDLTLDGRSYLFAVGWTGQWKCEISRSEAEIHLTVGLEYADFYLKPGERLTLPSVLFMEGKDGEDAAALRRRFRRVMAIDLSPLPEGIAHLPISIQPFDRYFRKHPYWATTAGQLETLAAAVKCGTIDTLWLDAAWFRDQFPWGVGNYSFAEGFEGGLKPVSDAAHAVGLRFMLWFEPERVYAGSEVHHEHPEFLLARKQPDASIWNGDAKTFLYNLGDETAWKWLRDTLVNFIRDNGVDNYRQDFNIDPLVFWLDHDEPGRAGITEIKYINGLYCLWDALLEEFPGLFIDNCSSGGRRLDLEMLSRAIPMWRSDVACSPVTPEAHRDVWNQNETLTLTEYLPYHAAASYQLEANIIRSSATSGLACSFDVLNPDFDFAEASRLLVEVKRLAGYWPGDFYPLTAPTLDEAGFAAYQVADGDRGFAMIFRRELCEADTFTVTLSAIDRTAEYAVTLTDEQYRKTETIVSGVALADGYAVILPDAHTSAVLEYKKI